MEEEEEEMRDQELEKIQTKDEEEDLADLDKFVISAMLAGVPFLKNKIKMFARKKENRLQKKVDGLEKELDLKKRCWLKRVEELEKEVALKNRRLKELESGKERLLKLNDTKELEKQQQKQIQQRIYKQMTEMSEFTTKLKVENSHLQNNVDRANATIAKNLEKIENLEAKNISLENKKSAELHLQMNSGKICVKMEKGSEIPHGDDVGVKEEYQESGERQVMKMEQAIQTEKGEGILEAKNIGLENKKIAELNLRSFVS